MARNSQTQIRNALAKVLEGDPASLAVIASIEHSVLRDAIASFEGPLIVSRIAVASVLRGLSQGVFPPELVQSWASFVRNGHIVTSGGPIQPLDIAYEGACEDTIADAISRLDEIGDTIDGEVSNAEAVELIRLLEES